MASDSLLPQVEDLAANIDELTAALGPLLNAPALSTSASKLPLLDKAKLYVHATYAIESLLFSLVRLHGGDAKAHPVFAELARVKAYFGKIQTAESAGQGAGRKLDKDAAGRFIAHGLAGNERYDRERGQQRERERAGAKRKLDELRRGGGAEGMVGTHTRFDGAAKRIRTAEEQEGTVPVVSAADLDEDGDEDEESTEAAAAGSTGMTGGLEEGDEGAALRRRKKNRKDRRDENFDAVARMQESLVKPDPKAEAWSGYVAIRKTDPSEEEAKQQRRQAKRERRRYRKGEEARADEMR